LSGLEKNIKSFCLSGNYPNKREILSSMADAAARKKKSTLPGFSPPVLDLYGVRGELLGDIMVREIDVPFICQKDPARAMAYVLLILRSRRGDFAATREIDRLLAAYLEGRKFPSVRIPDAATEWIVPCTSCEDFSVDLISDKGATLLRLSQEGYPVPDFVILTSNAYRLSSNELRRRIGDALDTLEALTYQKAGSADSPLVLAIRCAMPYCIPGVMPTYLNAGITDSAYPALVEAFGEEAAGRMYLNNLQNMLQALDPERLKALQKNDPNGPNGLLCRLDELHAAVREIRPRLLEDPLYQMEFFVKRAYAHYESNLDLLLTFSRGEHQYPALIFQKMVCTVRDKNSIVGILFSRHPRNGEGLQIESAKNIFGEEIMSGTVETETTDFFRREEIKEDLPAVYHFLPLLNGLEREFASPVTIEFVTDVMERHRFFALIQLNQSEMTGRAAVISVMDLYQAGAISQRRVPELIKPFHVKQIESDAIDPDSLHRLKLFCSGASILPRMAVSAQLYFSAEAALDRKKEGGKVCLCQPSFKPDDTVVMREMDALLSLTSAAIHVVTICQSFGLPALLNLERSGVRMLPGRGLINQDGVVVHEGEWVTVSSHHRCIYLGPARFWPARLLRYMRSERVDLEEFEKPAFATMARAYRMYNDLIANLKLEQISSLQEIIRLVILDLRGESEKARDLVNAWFDRNERLYVEEVLGSDMGDHLKQHTVFNLLTPERKIGFFKHALRTCREEKRSGYSAGAFMLGRFICLRQPVAFWRSFTPVEISVLINEWILFEKYIQLLYQVGERRITRAKKKILEEGLDPVALDVPKLKPFFTLKLSGMALDDILAAIPSWCDRQTRTAVELLKRPYADFFPPDQPWSMEELERICREEGCGFPGRS